MEKEKSLYLLTLSVRDCSGDDLEQAQSLFDSGLREMVQLQPIRSSLFFRFCFMELDVQSHPHLHCIAELRGKCPTYHEIRKCWRQACDLDYDPFVYIRRLPDLAILHPYPPAG